MKSKILVLTLVLLTVPVLAFGLVRFGYKCALGGDAVVPPVKTEAKGDALFDFSKDFKQLYFDLHVQNLSDVTEAHIHLGAAGKNGPPVVTLYPFGSAPPAKAGKFSGRLAKGAIIAANLEGPLKGKTLTDLGNEMLSGNAYIMVHTKAHPEGEIRGQIVRRPS